MQDLDLMFILYRAKFCQGQERPKMYI